MGWAQVISTGVGLLANHAQNSANKKAANAVSGAANQANQFAMGQYAPYTGLGQSATGGLTALNNGDYSGFLNAPDYKAAFEQGLQGVDRSAAARGSLYSGGHSADLLKFGSGLASQYLGNYRNSLMGQANLGYNAASGLSSLYGNNLLTGAGAQANYQQQRGQNNSQLIGGLGGMFNNYLGSQSVGGGGMGFSPIPVGAPDLNASTPGWGF